MVHAISIHALREEGDNFKKLKEAIRHISIHALREEGDIKAHNADIDTEDFYPRPPRGGRRFRFSDADGFFEFLSTPSARRATQF